jgi:hypothetical protein
MFEILESKLQLHQRFDILYIVVGWQASFYDADGDHLVARVTGETIAEAITGLEEEIKDYEKGRTPSYRT